jgi:hypothetical protein
MDATGWGDVVAVVAALISAAAAVFARSQVKLARRQAASAELSADAAQQQVEIMRRQFDAEQEERDERGRPDFTVIDKGYQFSTEVRPAVRGTGHTTRAEVEVEVRRLQLERRGGPYVVDLTVELEGHSAAPAELRLCGGPLNVRAMLGTPVTVEIVAKPGWQLAPERVRVELSLTIAEVDGARRRWERRVAVDVVSIRQA